MTGDAERTPRNFGGTEDNEYVAASTDRDRRITIEVDVPGVEVNPVRTEVRCGKVAVEVSEYGSRGSGSWAVWTPDKHTVDDFRGTYDGALEVAAAHVRERERRRLMFEALGAALDEQAPSPPGVGAGG